MERLPDDPNRRTARLAGWRAVAHAIREVNDYDHPITAHLTAERPIPSYNKHEDWLSLP